MVTVFLNDWYYATGGGCLVDGCFHFHVKYPQEYHKGSIFTLHSHDQVWLFADNNLVYKNVQRL